MALQSDYRKPLPMIDDDNREFWESCRRHEMRLQRCQQCQLVRYYPSPVCHRCGSAKADWSRVTGNATVYTYSVVYRAPSEGFAGDIPYVYAIVELEEGPMMATNVVGIDPEAVSIGMSVELVYDDVTPEVTLPKFRPVPTAS
jgi:uncharacterized protein